VKENSEILAQQAKEAVVRPTIELVTPSVDIGGEGQTQCTPCPPVGCQPTCTPNCSPACVSAHVPRPPCVPDCIPKIAPPPR